MTTTTTDEVTHLRALLAEQTARAERAEATASRLDAVVRAYPNATTDLAQWAKPTIALIDSGALQALSPVEDEDADGGTPWPGQCIGALINGFLDLASDVGKHNGDADRLVHNAVDELRKVARELRVAWADREMAIVALTKCGVALDVHSSSSLVSHAKSASRQVHDLLRERDASIAANAEMRAALVHIRERAASSIGEDESDAIDICDAIERLVGSALGEGDPLTGDLPRRSALSRTDLGAGMVAVPREVVERVRFCLRRDSYDVSADGKRVLADLDALLKKGGG